MFRAVRRWWGELSGYGACSECGDTWNMVEPYIIRYSPSNGMFPVCTSCAPQLSLEEIEHQCFRLWMRWGKPLSEYPKETIEGFLRSEKARALLTTIEKGE